MYKFVTIYQYSKNWQKIYYISKYAFLCSAWYKYLHEKIGHRNSRLQDWIYRDLHVSRGKINFSKCKQYCIN